MSNAKSTQHKPVSNNVQASTKKDTDATVWDNVEKVSAVNILSNNATANSGTIFLNGNHRLPVSVYLSFTLYDTTGPRPTDDDIKAALTWVNYANESSIDNLSFYTESDGEFNSTYNLYYLEGTNSVSKKVDLKESYDHTIDYQIVPSETIEVNDYFNLAIKIEGPRADCSMYIFVSDDSAANAEYHLNFVPYKVYQKPSDSGTSTATNHYLKWQEIQDVDTDYNPIADNNYDYRNAFIYHLTIDDEMIGAFQFNFKDFEQISDYKVLKPDYKSESEGLYLPCYLSDVYEHPNWNYFYSCVFWTYQRKYTVGNTNVMHDNQGITKGDVWANIIIWNTGSEVQFGGDMLAKSDMTFPPFNFTIVHTYMDFENTSDHDDDFGESNYVVPFTDNYGNSIHVTLHIDSTAHVTVSDVT